MKQLTLPPPLPLSPFPPTPILSIFFSLSLSSHLVSVCMKIEGWYQNSFFGGMTTEQRKQRDKCSWSYKDMHFHTHRDRLSVASIQQTNTVLTFHIHFLFVFLPAQLSDVMIEWRLLQNRSTKCAYIAMFNYIASMVQTCLSQLFSASLFFCYLLTQSTPMKIVQDWEKIYYFLGSFRCNF